MVFVSVLLTGFFKETVRHPEWTCRDPIYFDSRDPIYFDSRDPMILSDSRDPIRVPKTPLKKPGSSNDAGFLVTRCETVCSM